MTERKRQWDVCEAFKAINHELAFVTSDIPAAVERFMEEHLNAKHYDSTTTLKLKVKIDEIDKI